MHYQSGDDVVEGNVESFEEKEVLKIRAQGSARYYNWRSDKYRCPYYSRPKPRSGLLEHQMEHCRATSISSHDHKISAQHSALHKVLKTLTCSCPRPWLSYDGGSLSSFGELYVVF